MHESTIQKYVRRAISVEILRLLLIKNTGIMKVKIIIIEAIMRTKIFFVHTLLSYLPTILIPVNKNFLERRRRIMKKYLIYLLNGL